MQCILHNGRVMCFAKFHMSITRQKLCVTSKYEMHTEILQQTDFFLVIKINCMSICMSICLLFEMNRNVSLFVWDKQGDDYTGCF